MGSRSPTGSALPAATRPSSIRRQTHRRSRPRPRPQFLPPNQYGAARKERPARSPVFFLSRRNCNGPVTGCERLVTDNARMHLGGLFRHVCRRTRSQRGKGMVEYALILVLIAVVVIALLIILGNQVANVFCNISGAIGQ